MNHILHRNRITEIRIQFYFLIRKKKKKTSPAVVHGNAKETELPKNKLPIKKTKHNRRIEGTNEETRGREKYGGRVTNNIILIKKKKLRVKMAAGAIDHWTQRGFVSRFFTARLLFS